MRRRDAPPLFKMRARRGDFAFQRKKRRPRRRDVDLGETAGVARAQLREAADVGAGDMAELRIAACGLMIGHQHQGLAVAGDLDRAERNAVRDDVVIAGMGDCRPFEPIGHAIGLPFSMNTRST